MKYGSCFPSNLEKLITKSIKEPFREGQQIYFMLNDHSILTKQLKLQLRENY